MPQRLQRQQQHVQHQFPVMRAGITHGVADTLRCTGQSLPVLRHRRCSQLAVIPHEACTKAPCGAEVEQHDRAIAVAVPVIGKIRIRLHQTQGKKLRQQ